MSKTLGEKIVRVDFNTTGQDDVTDIKAKSAELINICDGLKGKAARLASLAITHLEIACMFAVKAATTSEEDRDDREVTSGERAGEK